MCKSNSDPQHSLATLTVMYLFHSKAFDSSFIICNMAACHSLLLFNSCFSMAGLGQSSPALVLMPVFNARNCSVSDVCVVCVQRLLQQAPVSNLTVCSCLTGTSPFYCLDVCNLSYSTFTGCLHDMQLFHACCLHVECMLDACLHV